VAARTAGDVGVEPFDGTPVPPGQGDPAVGVAFGAGGAGVGRGDVRAMGGGPRAASHWRALFQVNFVEDAHASKLNISREAIGTTGDGGWLLF
jgi:hypothetical protein